LIYTKIIIIIFFIDKTNALGFELYVILGQINGSGYPMAYLFLDNTKKDNGVRTAILVEFFKALHDNGLHSPDFFLTDKDLSQINAAYQVWPSIKIQLCLWHLKRAVAKRLADSSVSKINTYNAELAKESVNFIDLDFHPFPKNHNTGVRSSNNCDMRFCPKELRETIVEKMAYHFHLHPLIPNDANQYLMDNEIWLLSVHEMYEFCVQHDLKNVWAYLWMNWYQKTHWILWARAAHSQKICLFKTTMLVEAHWKVIKRDFLPKFFRPRLDLVVFIITNRLLPHHQRRYHQIVTGRETVSWRKDFKKEWKVLSKRDMQTAQTHVTDVTRWICSCRAFLLSRWPICYHLVLRTPNLNLDFFTTVIRQEVCPFLKHPLLQNDDNDNNYGGKYTFIYYCYSTFFFVTLI